MTDFEAAARSVAEPRWCCTGTSWIPTARCGSARAGTSGLGTSGSGDVLAGLAAGLLARGAQPGAGGMLGTHLHATSGERPAARIGRLGFLGP
ncbi:MAG: NAD(P)H-hydrate dehydratase [Pseudonocardiales bacterium]